MDALEIKEQDFEIKTHDFEENINHLKVFSEQEASDLELKKVNGSKDIGEWFAEWFMGGGIGKDHKVTGDELNEVTTQVQNNLIVINKNQKETKKEFGRVYAALKALDKDYIQAILISVEAIRKTNKKLEASQKVIKSNQTKIEQTQEDIRRSHKTLQKTILALQQFKERLDKYTHMADVDKMWNDIQKQHTSLGKLKEDSQELSDIVNEQGDSIALLNETKEYLNSIEHLSDIDKMWENTNSLKESISEQAIMITGLQEELKKKDSKISELEVAFSNKVKTIYMLVGGSMGLAVIELIVILTRMM